MRERKGAGLKAALGVQAAGRASWDGSAWAAAEPVNVGMRLPPAI